MEIIRTSRYLPAKSRPRNSRVTFEKTLPRESTPREPLNTAMYGQQLNIRIASEVGDIRGMILNSCI